MPEHFGLPAGSPAWPLSVFWGAWDGDPGVYMAALNHVSGTDVTVEGEEDGGNASRHPMLQQELVHWSDLPPSPTQPQGKLRPQGISCLALALAVEC